MTFYRQFLDRAALGEAYSPSRFVPDISCYVKEYERRSAEIRATLGNCQTLDYGAHPAERLDLFPVPGARGPCDTVVFIHGGYWQELSKDHHSFPARAFNAAGLNFAALGYGLAPALKPADMVGQCRAALHWLVSRSEALSIAPRLHLIGHSAGAQLAAMVTLEDRRRASGGALPICSVTTLSGVFDLRPIALTYVNDVLNMTDEEALLASPVLRVDLVQGELPRFRVAYAEREPAEFARQSLEFADALRLKGAEVAVSCVAGRNHFDIVLDLADRGSPMFQSTLTHIAGRAG